MTTSIKILFLTLSLYTLQTLHSLSTYAQLVSDFRVNDDTTNNEQYDAKVGVDSFGNFVVVWTDIRKELNEGVNVNVYCQRFSANGAFIGNNFRINETIGTSSSPAIAVRKDGSFLVCWKDFSVKARIFNNIGNPVTSSFFVNDTSTNRVFNNPSVGVDSDGNFVLSWQQYIIGQYGNIYFQRLDSTGYKLGVNQKVNDDSVNVNHEFPAITVRQDGSFIITWNDTRPPSQPNCDDIYMQMFDRLGNKLGINQRVNDDFNPIDLQFSPKISSDASGKFVIAWNDDRLDITHGEVYAQQYDNIGNKIGQNFRVTFSSVQYTKGVSSVDFRLNGDYLIYWTEFRNFIGVPYFQRYRNNSTPIGINFSVTSLASSTEKFASDCIIYNDKVISLWSDERSGPFDVYCNIRSFSNPDTTVNIIQTSTSLPEKFLLHQNYPNPFNSSTEIQFSVFISGMYKLEIYNNLGQKISEVINKYLTYGTYKIDFESGSLSSGVYQYILSSPKERLVKSFVLLK